MARAWLVAFIAFSGISIKWITFHSEAYPYTIKQPSSYRHVLLPDTPRKPVDYFSPSLGSYVTSVSISADSTREDPARGLRALRGQNLRITWLRIMGRPRPLYEADFGGLVGPWTQGRVVIVIGGRVWHLRISYARRFRNQRPIMLKMLRTFHTR